MKKLVEYVVKALVEYPEQVVIENYEHDDTVFIRLRLAKADTGKIIGKSGGTITAIRTVMSSVAAAKGKRITIEVLDSLGGSGSNSPFGYTANG